MPPGRLDQFPDGALIVIECLAVQAYTNNPENVN